MFDHRGAGGAARQTAKSLLFNKFSLRVGVKKNTPYVCPRCAFWRTDTLCFVCFAQFTMYSLKKKFKLIICLCNQVFQVK